MAKKKIVKKKATVTGKVKKPVKPKTTDKAKKTTKKSVAKPISKARKVAVKTSAKSKVVKKKVSTAKSKKVLSGKKTISNVDLTKTKTKRIRSTNGNSFPVAGIGASAGGLEALEGFFSNMPSQANLAIVVIQHLAPKYKSIMGSLLKKYTKMRILEITDGLKTEPNTIYLNPPDRDVAIMNRTLQLVRPLESHAARLPIDSFFRSLSEDLGEKAICIVLSGTGTDGTLGLKAIKGEGGMTMAQEESQAKYDSMPRSAINTGFVDFILPVEGMPGELVKYIKHPYIEKDVITGTTQQKYQSNVVKILLQVRTRTGHDFSNYKQNTIRRRIERRMAVHQIDKISQYLDYVRENHAEVGTLYKDLLIGVTNFFRDPDAFGILEKEVIPEILKAKKNQNLRVWVPGCATGEEAYSIAMILSELTEKSQKNFNIQIFGTDIDEDAVEYARAAVYPDSIAADVSKERLKRFFVKEDSTYKVKKKIREMLVFATQSLIKDPPFSKLDLVSCRNVLIYMDTVLQKKLLPVFHYTLNQNGFLFLGTSETIGEFTDLFSTRNSKWKIFERLGARREQALGYPIVQNVEVVKDEQSERLTQHQKEANIYQLAEKEILDKYAPPFVLVNDKHEIQYVNGKIHKYLLTPAGIPVFDIIKMAHEDLRYKLTTVLHKLAKKKEISITRGLKIRNNGDFLTVDLTVKPFSVAKSKENLTMVIFEEKEPPEKIAKKKKASVKTKKQDPQIINLRQELKSTKEYLQATIEELETSNEELKSTNEEMQSTNEELQSTNEELETSKEEQQSTNEELETVNSELQNKVSELSRSNNDLNNLLASTEIATIFLDTKLNIVRFTPSLTRLFNMLPSDLGRSISDITSKFNAESLYKDAEEVLETLIQKESDVKTDDGKKFILRIMPYRTVENLIDGIVVTFVDVTRVAEMKAKELIITAAREYAENIVDTVREPLIILDSKLQVVSANKSFYRAFQVLAKETEGTLIYKLGNGQWDITGLRKLLEDILPEKNVMNDYKVKHKFESIGEKTMLLNARQIITEEEEEGGRLILLAIEDITDKK
ncbi:MAG: PAS domain-containing protein [Candidatus Scalindua sp.]|jgi:two-component system CheB/CheR fusion protein|nr:PAS domain-containing protein [Candidatus Scalindua sp.]MBT5307153.1 PAS domain-containing protein [Candidatus Scalindua sp.]MBT6050099.1 PAS domain-containing protein [Candidatus Scalindua sp.]MBT6229975.1 PAS domain-containing protein [Candidatus Scalindua sp.]MBT6561498.1 PAS domain-containing protein [Candidatus Scalindua sp.]